MPCCTSALRACRSRGFSPAPHVPMPRHVALGIDTFQVHAKAPQTGGVFQHLGGRLIQRSAVVLLVAQGEGAVAEQVDVPDLDVGFACAQVVLA